MSLLSFKFRVQVICGILDLVSRIASLKFSDQSMLTITTSKRPSLRNKSQSRLDPATDTSPLMSHPLQPPPPVASDSVQPPPEVAPDSMESINPSWQIATSRRSTRTLRQLSPVISRTVVMHDDVINPPPVSAATFSASAFDCSPTLYLHVRSPYVRSVFVHLRLKCCYTLPWRCV